MSRNRYRTFFFCHRAIFCQAKYIAPSHSFLFDYFARVLELTYEKEDSLRDSWHGEGQIP